MKKEKIGLDIKYISKYNNYFSLKIISNKLLESIKSL